MANQPENATYRRFLIKSLNNLAGLIRVDQSGRTDEAQRYLKQAVEICDTLVRDFPRDAIYRESLMACSEQLRAPASKAWRSMPILNTFFSRARPLAQQLEAEFPNMPRMKAGLAQVNSNLGIAYEQTGRFQEAEHAYREALLKRRELLASQPGLPDYHYALGSSLSNLANLLQEQGKLTEAHNSSKNRSNTKSPLWK